MHNTLFPIWSTYRLPPRVDINLVDEEMIDYEKLKQVYEMADQWTDMESITATVCVAKMLNGSHKFILSDGRLTSIASGDLDDLLQKLQELTQSKPKYKDAWYIYDGKLKVTKVEKGEFFSGCDETDPRAFGCKMFNIKTEAIQSQIDYWTSLLNQESSTDSQDMSTESKQEPCQHESSDSIYLSCPPQYKCKKCGEFYG